MRILMLTCHPGIRGPFPKILPLLAATLRGQGCHVVTEPWGRKHDAETFLDKVLGRPGDILRVWRTARREKFDVLFIHTSSEWPNYSRDIPAMWLCRRLVRRIVVLFHGSTPDLVHGPGNTAFKNATKTLLRATDATFVLSQEEKREWHRFHPEGRFDVVTNPFESRASLPPVSGPLPWKLPAGVPVLLYVGRLMEPKGIFDLLEALARLHGRTPFHLITAGNGPSEAAFKERIQSLQLGEHVTLAGYVTGDQLRQAYQAADVFVLPSWSEGFPTVITEAMDAGLPIVTTYIRGAVDHLQEGVHAKFVPPRQPEKLAAALEEVLNDSALRQRMGQANRAKVKDFAPAPVAGHYLEVLREITGAAAKPTEPTAVARAA